MVRREHAVGVRGPAGVGNVYYLFDIDASWQGKPDPLVSWGYTIDATLDVLEANLDAMLASE